MSHPDEGPLDDGTLHAYLDGALPSDEVRRIEARLAASPEDQRRLERARAFLAEADDLLELVDLDPPLQDPKVVPITQAPTVRARKRFDLPALGWAAGFVVMIGGMWLLTPSARRIDETVAAAAPARSDAVPMAAAPAPAAVSAPTAAPEARTAPSAAVSELAARRAPAAAQPGALGTAADRKRTDDAPVRAELADAATDAARETADAGRRMVVAGNAAAANTVAAGEVARGVVPMSPSAAPAAKASLQERAVDADAVGARPAPVKTIVELREDTPEIVVVAEMTAAQATRVLGHPLRVVPGGNLRRIDQLQAAVPVVRLLYWLPDGTGLMLYESTDAKALVPTSTLAAPTAGASAARVRGQSPEIRWADGGLHLRMRAPIAVDSLERLRAAIRIGSNP